MRSWYAIRARDPDTATAGAEVTIYDEIGAFGVSAKAFLAELGALPDDAPLTLRLNSPGGSVFDAVAIHNALKRHAGGVTVWIDGIAASAASYVAMAGTEVIMPGNAFLMLHDPAGMVMGPATDMRAMAEALDKIKTSLVAGYAVKSGKPDEEIAALMAAETWLDAEEAVGLGFADRIADPVRIAARFEIGRFVNAPPALVAEVEAVVEAEGETGTEAQEAAPEADADGGTASDTARDGAVADADGAAQTDPDPPPEPAPIEDPASIDAAAIRAEAMAHARAIVDLCRLAGQPQMAAGFLADETSLDKVRTALIDARAAAEPEITSSHPQPGPGMETRPWGDVIARTFRRKG